MALNLAENLVEDAWQLHYQLAESLTSPLSKLLNVTIAMECISVGRVRWSEFLGTLKDPMLLCLADMPPLDGQLILEIQLPLAHQVVAKLLNSPLSKEKAASPPALTTAERVVLMQFVNLVLTAFTAEWKRIYPQVDTRFGALEDSAANLPKSYPNGTALLAEIELAMDVSTREKLRLCYPPDLLYAIQALPASPAKSDDKVRRSPIQPSSTSRSMSHAELLTAIEDLLEIYTHRIEGHLNQLEDKVDALSRKRGWRR